MKKNLTAVMDIALMGLMSLMGLISLTTPALAQDELALSFSDPFRPGTVSVQTLDGNVTVRGYDGDQVIIQGLEETLPSEVPERAQGLQRIASAGLTIEESNNLMRINPGWDNASDLVIQVPFGTSVTLEVLDGNIEISDVQGEIELFGTDSVVRLERITGPVSAHSVDGEVVASMVNLALDAPTSISTVDGDIDLTLPANSGVTLSMRSLSGDIYTDFEIELSGSTNDPLEGPGAFRGRGFGIGSSLIGTINGGGTEVQLHTIDGNIYVRRGN